MTQPTASVPQDRSLDLTLLRGVAIFAVVCLHVLGNYTKTDTREWTGSVFSFLWICTRVGVPLFVFLSGRLLAMRYAWPFATRRYFTRRVQMVLVPYLIFSLLYLSLYSIQKHHWDFAEWPARLIRGGAAEHFWFFRFIIELYILYPLFAWCRGPIERMKLGLPVLALVIFTHAASNLSLFPFQMAFAKGHLYSATFFHFWLYFIFGMASVPAGSTPNQKMKTFEKPAGRLAAGIVVLVCILIEARFLYLETQPGGGWSLQSGLRQVVSVLLEPLWVWLAIRLLYSWALHAGEGQGLVSRLMVWLGKNSYGIYLVHLIFLSVAVRGLRLLSIHSGELIFYPLALALTLAASLAVIDGMRRLPRLRWMIGE